MRLLTTIIAVAAAASVGSSVAAATAADSATKGANKLPVIPTDVPRGVLRALVDKYPTAAQIAAANPSTPLQWKCLDGSKTILASRINDEYCDCADGSDEPGTSACSLETIGKKDWQFRCQDSGSQFKDRLFRHSQVNDGICDCCDGSDEYAGHVQCPNTCAELAAVEEAASKAREEKRQKGLEAKRQMEQEVEAKIAAALQTVADNEAKAKAAEAKLEEIKPRKDAAEVAERGEKDVLATKFKAAESAWQVEQRKKLSQAQHLKPHWGCVRFAQTRDCKGDGPMEDVNRTCKDLIPSTTSGFCVCRKRTPEYLAKIHAGEANLDGEKVEPTTGSADAAATDAAAVADSDDEQPEDDNINPLKHRAAYNQQQVDRLVGVEAEDTLLRYDCGHEALTCDEMCDFGGDEEKRKVHKEKYSGEGENDGSRHETEDAKALRNDYHAAEMEKRSADAAVAEAKKKLEALQNDDIALAFRAMNGLCYNRQFHNYRYSFCPFSKAEQDSISLGVWKGFGEQTYSSWGAKHDFSIMKFEGGSQCWGGPQRSLTVRVICGPTNEILSVEEPSMCTYLIKFQSPAICE